MSDLLKKLDAHLPFNKSERIIIGVVLLLHALPALEFLHLSKRPPPMDDTRVMANLVSPEASNTQQPPAATPPKPKEEKKVAKEKPQEKPTEKPSPTQAQQPSQQQNQSQSKSETQPQNAAVAPATSGGASGTPIQTDYGELTVLYQPDADAYYPSFSKRSGEEGSVKIRVLIDESGNVVETTIIDSSNYPRLDRAAREISQRYRFKPVIKNGQPVKISTAFKINFRLK